MALTIVLRSGELDTPPELTLDAPRIVIGRSEGCEVRLPDPSVSHRHASIRQRGSDYILLDEDSTNGTYVGSVRLSPGAPRMLRTGELIRVGRVWLEIRIEHVPVTANPAELTKELALALVAQALDGQGEDASIRVLVVDGPDTGREMVLAAFDKPYVIGRGRNVDLTIDDVDSSRRHVEVVRRGDGIFARDLGSKNGSTLNDSALGGELTAWPESTRLVIGPNSFQYRDPVRDALDELERSADEQIADDESLEPPVGTEAPPALGQQAPSELAGLTMDEPDGVPESARAAAPIVDVPKRKSKPRPAQSTGWNSTDIVIAVVAVTILALSAVGLWWLFRA